MSKLRILQIGAGSMGTRRLRDLSKRNDVELALFDGRADRRNRAGQQFGIATFDALDAALRAWNPQALSISTPPNQHEELVNLALERGLHHFCEANIWTPDFRRVEQISSQQKLVSAPSNSMAFLPSVKELRRIVREELGTLHAYQMLLSTYMPGWHPGEGAEYYARHRTTAPAREMVPFELLAMNHVFGQPARATGIVSQRGKLDVKSEDTWSVQMTLANGAHGQLIVLMASPETTRKGACAGDNGIVEFDLVTGEIARRLPARNIDDRRTVGGTLSPPGVLEEAYREEIDTFVDAIQGKTPWPFPYSITTMATATLAAAERSAVTGKWIDVDPSRQPAELPDGYAAS
jgi:predicted dehydrogenase